MYKSVPSFECPRINIGQGNKAQSRLFLKQGTTMEQNSIKNCVWLWKTGFYLHIAIIYTRYIVFGRINELCEMNH